MKLPEVSVKRPVTVIMMVLIVILLGAISLTRLPIDLFPKFELPIAIVMTQYPQTGPQEIEKMITNPIEGAVATVENIDSVTSTTTEGNSIVIANFKSGTDMNFAALQMREKIDMVKAMFPDEVSTPMVMKIDPSMMPIVQLTITDPKTDLAELQSFAEDTAKPALERVAGVASVTVSGGYQNEIKIRTHQEKMQGYGLSISTLAGVLAAENLNAPGGQVQKGNQDLTIRTTAEFKSLKEIEELLIPLPTGGQVRLKDIADVELDHTDLTSIARTNGVQSINIAVQKQSDANTVSVANEISGVVKNLEQGTPDRSFHIVMDQSTFIKQTINTVMREAVLGGLLAILILFIFFHNVRNSLISATAIPIAVMGTFAVLFFMDVTINMMTLGGLSLAMGRLIDDNIVALENIYRHRQEGYSKIEAAVKGVSEVGMAITASTLATVAVFLPIVFVEGMTAELFRDLALTVTISLLASLMVSLTLVPSLAAKMIKVEDISKERKGFMGRLDSFGRGFDHWFARIEQGYQRFLHYALGHRKTIVGASILIFLLSAASLLGLGAELMPTADSGQITIQVTLPDGARLHETDEMLAEIEGKLEGIPEIKTAFTQVGSGGTISIQGNVQSTGSITVQLLPLAERKRSVGQVVDEIRELTKDIAGATISTKATDNMSMGATSPIDISIKGDDLDQLKQISNDFKDKVRSVEGTREVDTSMSEGVPEVQVQVNRLKAAQYRLTAAQISKAVQGTISGTTATRYTYEGNEINVVITGDETFKQSISNLQQTPIPSPLGMNVPLSQVAEVKTALGPTTIDRSNQTRVAHVTSQIAARDLASVTADIQKQLDAYQMPKGYTYTIGGENEELVKSFQSLGMALVLSIILVYMILASLFESLLHPFTIILSLPMGFSGAMLGLFITRNTISLPVFIGLILLVGIVVSNAIVLVDYINKRRERGEGREEAIEKAGPIRLRPILMTALATILAQLPMAMGMGEGSETMAPMAIVVISGLLLSTISTLLLVPVIYTIFEDIRDRFKNRKKGTRLGRTEVMNVR